MLSRIALIRFEAVGGDYAGTMHSIIRVFFNPILIDGSTDRIEPSGAIVSPAMNRETPPNFCTLNCFEGYYDEGCKRNLQDTYLLLE